MQMNQDIPLVSIITINYKSWPTTKKLLRSLNTIEYQNLEIIVIDNKSDTKKFDTVRQEFPQYQFVASKTNLGFSGGNNLGIVAAKGDYILLLNNDTILTKGAIERMVKTYESESRIGAVSPLLCFQHKKDGRDIIQYAGTTKVNPFTGRNTTIARNAIDLNQFISPVETYYGHGAAMLVSRKVIEDIGLMPEDYFLYYEELDWCHKMRSKGYSIVFEPRAKVYHDESPSIGKNSPLKTYYLNRNRFLFVRKNYKTYEVLIFAMFYTLLALPKESLKFLFSGNYKNLKSIWKAYFWNINSIFRPKAVLPNTPLPNQGNKNRIASEIA